MRQDQIDLLVEKGLLHKHSDDFNESLQQIVGGFCFLQNETYYSCLIEFANAITDHFVYDYNIIRIDIYEKFNDRIESTLKLACIDDTQRLVMLKEIHSNLWNKLFSITKNYDFDFSDEESVSRYYFESYNKLVEQPNNRYKESFIRKIIEWYYFDENGIRETLNTKEINRNYLSFLLNHHFRYEKSQLIRNQVIVTLELLVVKNKISQITASSEGIEAKVVEKHTEIVETTNVAKSKLKWLGTPSQFGWFIQELIRLKYLERPTSAYKRDAEFYLNLFEIEGEISTLAKELSESTNSLTAANRLLIKIPEIEKLS